MAKALRVNKTALFERIGYAPHSGQLAVHQSLARYRVLACGARWGKSTCAAMEAVVAMLAPCLVSLGWVVAPTYDLTLRIFDQVRRCMYTHFKDRIVVDDARNQRIVIRNLGGGLSTLQAKTADNPMNLLGEGLDYVIIDEAAKLRDTVWKDFLSARLLDKGGWALFLSTPAGKNWFYKLFKRGEKGGDPGYESWCSPSWQNPHLARKLIEEERSRMDAESFEEQYGAKFAGAPEPCKRCLPPEGFSRSRCLVVRGDAILLRCPECGDLVDEKGISRADRGADGTRKMLIIHLRGDHDEPTPEEAQAALERARGQAGRVPDDANPNTESAPEIAE